VSARAREARNRQNRPVDGRTRHPTEAASRRWSMRESQKQGLMMVVFGVAIILVVAAVVVLVLGLVKL